MLDRVRAELAHGEQEVGLLLLGNAVADELLTQPLPQPQEMLGLTRHRKGAARGWRRHGRRPTRVGPAGRFKMATNMIRRRIARRRRDLLASPLEPRRLLVPARRADRVRELET